MCARHQVSLPYPSTDRHPHVLPTRNHRPIWKARWRQKVMHIAGLARNSLTHVDVRPSPLA